MVCAPRPSATPITPAEATIGPRLKPSSLRIMVIVINQITPFNAERRTVPAVRARSR